MKRLILVILIFCMSSSLCACTGQNLEEVQEKIIGDQFVSSRPLETYHETNGIEYKMSSSSLLEFYEDGTFFLATIERWRTYKDGVIYRSEYLDRNRDETEKYYGTFEIEKKAEGIVAVLSITTKIYEEYDGTTKKVDTDEQYNEVKELDIRINDGLIQSIGGYKSINYAEQTLKDVALN